RPPRAPRRARTRDVARPARRLTPPRRGRCPRGIRGCDGRRRRGAAPAGAARSGSRPELKPGSGRSECPVRVSWSSLNAHSTFRLGLEAVADAVARLDERVPRRAAVDLLPQAPDEDVDRAVAPRLTPAPQLLEQLVARDHSVPVERKLIQEPELRR